MPTQRTAVPSRFWLAETGLRPNRLVAFDPSAGKFTHTVDTEGGEQPNTIRHMVFHGPTREIWYGTDRNTVGRLEVLRHEQRVGSQPHQEPYTAVMAAGTIVTIPLVILVLVFQRRIVAGLTAGAVKG